MNIAQAKSRFSIVDILTRFEYRLEPHGRQDYVCRCPFHTERTASFHVYVKEKSYHCFGCGAHGDVVSLVAVLKCGGSTKDALQWLQQLWDQRAATKSPCRTCNPSTYEELVKNNQRLELDNERLRHELAKLRSHEEIGDAPF